MITKQELRQIEIALENTICLNMQDETVVRYEYVMKLLHAYTHEDKMIPYDVNLMPCNVEVENEKN